VAIASLGDGNIQENKQKAHLTRSQLKEAAVDEDEEESEDEWANEFQLSEYSNEGNGLQPNIDIDIPLYKRLRLVLPLYLIIIVSLSSSLCFGKVLHTYCHRRESY